MLFSFLLAFSLSIDALGIGLSYGLRRISFPPLSLLLLSLETFLAMEGFLLLGRLLSSFLPPALGKGLSVFFLLAFGLWLCFQGLGKNSEKKEGQQPSPLHSPSCCDKDSSSVLEPKEALLLGFILSIDSFAIGLSAAVSGLSLRLLPLFAALFQAAFLSWGAWAGRRLLLRSHPKESLWSLLSGGILVFLALLRLMG